MKRPVQQNGLSLPTVMVMLTLTSTATLMAWRNLWVNDQLLSAEADHLRTQHVAQAVLPVAVADIVGPLNNNALANVRHTPGDATHTHAFFPTSISAYDLLRQRLNIMGTACSAGICAPGSLNTNATQASDWKAQTATAMAVETTASPYGNNTAWYWVEVFPHTNTASPSASFVYRITTLAYGLTPGSATVLQAIWAPHSDTSTAGQWQSWHVLHD